MNDIVKTTLKVSEIKNNPNNPRLIKDDKFKSLVQSIKDFPEMLDTREVVVNKDYIILGGNMRFKAAKEAGLKEIPVKIVDWSEDKQRQFIIKDNVSGGEWDWDLLANEWDAEELDAWGLDTPDDWGEDKEVEEDEAPEVDESEPPKSKLGEVYQLGRHRVMCGDSTEASDVYSLIDNEIMNVTITDPPYGIRRDKGFSGAGGFGGKGKAIPRTQYEGDWDSDIPPKECFDLMLGITKKAVIFGGNFFAHVLPQGKHWLVWDKKNTMPTFGDAELAWTNIDRDSVKIKVFEYNGLIGREKERHHATQKPLGLIAEVLTDYSEPKQNILDLFLGSGTTLIACEQTDRTCYGMELDPKYVDVIRKRYHKFVTGNEEGWEDGTPAV